MMACHTNRRTLLEMDGGGKQSVLWEQQSTQTQTETRLVGRGRPACQWCLNPDFSCIDDGKTLSLMHT